MPQTPPFPKRAVRRVTRLRAAAALVTILAMIVGSGLVSAGFTGSGNGLNHTKWGSGQDVSNRVCGKGPQARLVDTAMTFIDGLNSGEFSAWRSVLADDFTAVYAPTGPLVLDQDTAEMINQIFPDSFNDLIVDADRVLVSASCDYVVIHFTAQGTHTGDFIAPTGTVITATGNYVMVTGVYTAEIRHGEIVREWTHWDLLSFLVQLGVVTPP
jgi:hypothetical protein